MPVIPQILGNDPDAFVRMAGRLADLGYPTVNWNLGCPYPMVAKKQRGSGLLPHPDRIDAFLERVVPRVPGGVSIKARLGRYSEEEIFRLIPVFNRYPLREVILHPRTGVQMYDGRPDIEVFERCLTRLCHPVVYNGDIRGLADFAGLSARFPAVERWMIGRGALINPFLPSIIKSGADAASDKIARFREFHDALFAAYREVFSGPGHLVERMKGFWAYFSQAFDDTRKLIRQIRRIRRPEAYMARVARFLEGEAVWRA
jgi:tRNA-dihydrouridine synthase